MIRVERRLVVSRWLLPAVPLVSVAGALVIAGLLLLVTGHPPVATYLRLFERAFVVQGALSDTLVTASPLLLTGLAAAAAFRMRVWNIGAEGQLYLGAIGASAAGLALHGRPTGLVILAMAAAGVAAGAAWAAVAGVLRAAFAANEIITTLMLNYVAGLLLTWLIFDSHSYWRDLTSSSARVFPQGKTLPPEATWPSLLTAFNPALDLLTLLAVVAAVWTWRRRRQPRPHTRWPTVAAFALLVVVGAGWATAHPNVIVRIPLGFLVGIGGACLLWWLYRSTRFGFEVRAIGDSPAAARYAGMHTGRKVVAVMALSGGFAGLGGASQVGDFRHLLDPRGLQQASLGYTGIVVAALARFNPFAVVLVAVLLGALTNAGFSLQGRDFPAGLVGMLQGMILACALAGELLVRYQVRIGRGVTREPTGLPPESAVATADAADLVLGGEPSR
jgi:general nucleoside transport system permease protein